MANIVGTKWGDPTIGTAGGTVTWSIVGAGEDISRFGVETTVSASADSFLTIDYVQSIANMFAEWSRYGDVEFEQVADGGGAAGVGNDADIRIFFGAIPGGTAGYAFYPSAFGSAIGGDILIDTLSKFNTKVWLFEAVVLHEIGHALGLGHVSSNSVMTPVVGTDGLQADDIQGIIEIYGPQDDLPDDGSVGDDGTGGDGHDHDPDTDPDHDHDHDPDSDHDSDPPGDGVIAGDGLNNFLVGTAGADTIQGLGGNDTIKGEGDADAMSGGSGDDRLLGGAGADTLDGGDGDDFLKGGTDADVFAFADGHGNDTVRDFSGNDVIDLSGVSSLTDFDAVADNAVQLGGAVFIETGDGHSILMQGVALDSLDSDDFIFGDAPDDPVDDPVDEADIIGDDAGNKILGTQEADVILGLGGNDTLKGDLGDDMLEGGVGDDRLLGGSGRDTLDGGAGTDFLKGGGDADVFAFADGHGDDTVRDFTDTLDLIDLSDVTGFSGFADVQNAASQAGDDVMIDTGAGNSILLVSVSLSALDAQDFVF